MRRSLVPALLALLAVLVLPLCVLCTQGSEQCVVDTGACGGDIAGTRGNHYTPDESGNGAHVQPGDDTHKSCGCGALNRDAAQTSTATPTAADASAASVSSTGDSASSTPATVSKDQQASSSPYGETEEEAGLIPMAGGLFTMGSDEGFFPEDGEGPAREVEIDPFLIGKHEVSNERFRRFVEATGYRTEAEVFGNSFVVEQFISKEVSQGISSAVAAAPWWLPVQGANWRHPRGPDSAIDGSTKDEDLSSHPVIHVSWNDAQAFCHWSRPGGRLPTEAEWEYAASAGLKGRRFPWGNKEKPGNEHRMNTWQSTLTIPVNANVFKHSFLPIQDGHRYYSSENSAEDGYVITAPVDAYPPNKFGLHNTVGNVWEWCEDWFTNDRSNLPKKNPRGPPTGEGRVKKGGSFMCNQFTCYRYRVAARMMLTPDSSAQNVGFRCAADIPQ